MAAQLLFAMLKHPAQTGTLVPSSRVLARTMAHGAEHAALIVELGAGTGAVTRALVQRKRPETPLIAVELQPRLAHTLRRRFPRIDVRTKSAKHVLDHLENPPENVALVSSLPFRSLPDDVVAETVDSIAAFLRPSHERRLIQFTYHIKPPFTAPEGLAWRRVATVWRNTPPATVWELRAHSV